MNSRARLTIGVAAIALVVSGFLFLRVSKESPQPVADAPGLDRSEAVVAAKIARKQAKIAGEHKGAQHPDGYAEHRSMVRSHPEGTNVTQLLLEAKRHVEAMPQVPGDRDAGIWDWYWLGPGNIGGRVRAILTHPDDPDILWAGSVSGGIWKTTNGGLLWHPQDDFLPSLAITSLAMDPINPDIIYAGTGEGFASDGLPGAGVFRSFDGGDNWTQLMDIVDPDAYFVYDIAHHPSVSGELLACTSDQAKTGKIWHTTDGGNNWNPVHDPPDSIGAAMDIKYDPDSPNVVIAGYAHGAYRSESGGAFGSWIDIATGGGTDLPDDTGRCEIAFATDSDMVYASCSVPRGENEPTGEIWRSLDNGVTWELRNDSVYPLGMQGHYDNVIWVEPQFPTSIMVGGIDLWKSIDGGFTLIRMSNWCCYHTGTSAHADQHAITPHIDYDPYGNRTIYFGNDGGVQKNTLGFLGDEFYGWGNLANNLGITQFYHADANPDGSVILGGTQDNDDLRYRTEDGRHAWYQAETGDGTFCAIDPLDGSYMYGAYVRLQIQRSTNAGATYHDSHDGIEDAADPQTALFVAPFALDKVAPYNLIAGGESIWRSYDHASNWHSVLDHRTGWPLCSSVEICPTQGSEVVWVGYTDGQIWKTENHTVDWTQVNHNGGVIPDHFIIDLEISPHDPDVVLVVTAGYWVNSGVYLTTDGGQTWTHRPGTGEHTLPVVHANCITFHPRDPNWIYLGTDIGLFASEDMGQTWNVTPRYGWNEGPVFTEVSDLIWHSYSTLVAVTHGRGMYECTPLPTVWVDLDNNGEEDGTHIHPWNTFTEGHEAIGNGATLIVAGGDYDEGAVVITKRIEIQGTEGTAVIR